MTVTILELAEHRLGRWPVKGADFEEAMLPTLGGCEVCGAGLAPFNAYPSRTGFLRCRGCITDLGWESVREADEAIFGGSAA